MTLDIRIWAPATARAGELVEIRTLALTPADPAVPEAERVPQRIVLRFTCDYGGRRMVDAEIGESLAQDVQIVFALRVDRAGEVHLEWQLADGTVERRLHAIAVAD
jgi:sulfur-oxidizing protein SoxZ